MSSLSILHTPFKIATTHSLGASSPSAESRDGRGLWPSGPVLSTDVKLLVKAAARVGAVGGLRTAARVGVLCHRSPSGRRPEWGETAVGGP